MSENSRFMIAPSILSADFANLQREIEAVTTAGADWIHVDVMDGHFVPNLTIGAPVVKSLKPISKLPLDCHLMIENPENYFADFAAAGADYLTVHIEALKDPAAALKKIRELGMKPGLTLKPATDVKAIMPYLPLCDLVLIMTVNPGFSGQGFMHDQVAKVKAVKVELTRLQSKALIEVDGGVNRETAKFLVDADVLVAGNAIFKATNYTSAIASLKEQK